MMYRGCDTHFSRYPHRCGAQTDHSAQSGQAYWRACFSSRWFSHSHSEGDPGSEHWSSKHDRRSRKDHGYPGNIRLAVPVRLGPSYQHEWVMPFVWLETLNVNTP